MAAGGERGAIEGPERACCEFSYLAVIGIFPCPIALHEASLWLHLTQYGKQKTYYALEQAPDDIRSSFYPAETTRLFWRELSYIVDAGSGEF